MHNIWLIAQREYLERVKTKAFIIFTVLVPLLFGSIGTVAGKFVTMRSGGTQKLVLLTESNPFADSFRRALASQDKNLGTSHDLTVDHDISDAHIAQLTAAVESKQISSYLIATDSALSQGQVDFRSPNSNDFVETEAIRSAASHAAMNLQLVAKGFSPADIERLTKPLHTQTTTIHHGKTGVVDAGANFTIAFVPTILLFITVMTHGINIMRSILEEKSSRVMEVMLSTVSAKEMMAGKIVGVGAVGITQLLIWLGFGIGVAGPMTAVLSRSGVHIEAAQIILFATFFLLGFLLYSGIYAAVGAMVNSEQEAQQIQFIVMFPLLFAYVFATYVISHPSSPAAVWLSIFPFFAPLLMMARVMTGSAATWQIALAIVLMMATTYGILVLTSRIYRVGILMYGKRPTLPEILRWIRYAY